MAFFIKKSRWKVEVNVVAPQELGVCGKLNEINGEKIILCLTAEKKIAFDV